MSRVVVVITDASGEALYNDYSIPDVDIDLTVVDIVMHVHAVPCSPVVIFGSRTKRTVKTLKHSLVEHRTAVVELQTYDRN